VSAGAARDRPWGARRVRARAPSPLPAPSSRKNGACFAAAGAQPTKASGLRGLPVCPHAGARDLESVAVEWNRRAAHSSSRGRTRVSLPAALVVVARQPPRLASAKAAFQVLCGAGRAARRSHPSGRECRTQTCPADRAGPRQRVPPWRCGLVRRSCCDTGQPSTFISVDPDGTRMNPDASSGGCVEGENFEKTARAERSATNIMLPAAIRACLKTRRQPSHGQPRLISCS